MCGCVQYGSRGRQTGRFDGDPRREGDPRLTPASLQQDREIRRLRGELARAGRDGGRCEASQRDASRSNSTMRERAGSTTVSGDGEEPAASVAAGMPDVGLAHATVGRAAARARDEVRGETFAASIPTACPLLPPARLT